ncbi:MAG: hypothetical protein C5B49_10770 [Bdellovibrio sp.]|nr:MAG: hypothetical protein C5B49_10770 [Bdellovibrio sp.]
MIRPRFQTKKTCQTYEYVLSAFSVGGAAQVGASGTSADATGFIIARLKRLGKAAKQGQYKVNLNF